MKACLVCEASIEPFISFGKMPIANGFLGEDEFADEFLFDLNVGFCSTCKMVQLTEHIDRDLMFHDEYSFFSSTSQRMADHFKAFASGVIDSYLDAADPFVVEIGSNDGIMLQHFAKAGIRHLGIEPSGNVAQAAIDKGIKTISRFFDEELAREIVAENGQVDAFIGANVMCHIPYLHSVAEGCKILLKPDGVLMFEDPYLSDIVEKTSYDQIYDEHAFYFSVTSITHLFAEHGLEVVGIAPQDVHGGSMRYIIAHQGAKEVSSAVIAQRSKEESLGLHRAETYDQLKLNIERSRNGLMEQLLSLQAQGRRVVGYGATSKSTTVTNYCGITPDLVEFISDTTPIKQGKFSPGAHIPIRPYEDFAQNYPDCALLFAWNHSAEIMEKEQKFRDAGGQWLVYVPRVEVL